MRDLIVPAIVGFVIGLPALVFSVVQWVKTWGRENRQIAATTMEAALNKWLEFERARLEEAEKEKTELTEENSTLRAENFDLWSMFADLRKENAELRERNTKLLEAQEVLNASLRDEERRMTDDRRGEQSD